MADRALLSTILELVLFDTACAGGPLSAAGEGPSFVTSIRLASIRLPCIKKGYNKLRLICLSKSLDIHLGFPWQQQQYSHSQSPWARHSSAMGPHHQRTVLCDLPDSCLLQVFKHLSPLPDKFSVGACCWVGGPSYFSSCLVCHAALCLMQPQHDVILILICTSGKRSRFEVELLHLPCGSVAALH